MNYPTPEEIDALIARMEVRESGSDSMVVWQGATVLCGQTCPACGDPHANVSETGEWCCLRCYARGGEGKEYVDDISYYDCPDGRDVRWLLLVLTVVVVVVSAGMIGGVKWR